MSVWDWIHEHDTQAIQAGDFDRLRLRELFDEAGEYFQRDPDLALALLRDGINLAKSLNQPWWVLFFEHWTLQVLTWFKFDFRDAVSRAVRCVLEARKPGYERLPQRICLHEDLIWAYMGVDPLGHQAEVRQALDYMSQEIDDSLECRFCLMELRTEFALARQEINEAESWARQELALACDAGADHYELSCYVTLCTIAGRREDWDALEQWVPLAESLARQRKKDAELSTALAWKAVLARARGDEELARRSRRQALAARSRIKSQPSPNHFAALIRYHELAEQWEDALQVLEYQLSLLKDCSRNYLECRCRIRRCELLARLGRLDETARNEAREAARRLRDPAPHLQEIDRLGSTSA